MCDVKQGKCTMGSYKPLGGKPAHQRLAEAGKVNTTNAVAGSIKSDGSVQFRSESINAQRHHRCDMGGTKAAERAQTLLNKGRVHQGEETIVLHVLGSSTGRSPSAVTASHRPIQQVIFRNYSLLGSCRTPSSSLMVALKPPSIHVCIL